MKNKSSNISLREEIIALVNCNKAVFTLLSICNFQDRKLVNYKNASELAEAYHRQCLNIVAVISQSEIAEPYGIELLESLNKQDFPKVPFFLVSKELDRNVIKLALRAGVVDVFKLPFKVAQIESRLNFVIQNWKRLTKDRRERIHIPYKIPNETRLFDILFSAFLLTLLSPLIVLIIIAIKLESRGSVFTHSLRAGSNYRIFKMFSFRMMQLDADNRINLSHTSENNTQLQNNSVETGLCESCRETRVKCQFPVYADQVTWCEKKFQYNEKLSAHTAEDVKSSFHGFTKVGKFLNYTRFSQIPQLFNVLRGDMSIVGNLPLPLSDAEKLTTDKYVLRFMAPAGITGLWQIEKRKKGYDNKEGRLVLDNRYARNHTFQMDIIILAKTIPALLK
ncbi:sugar transferase [Daejeonella oryzae]|uniref:sugar transferase n=1 Tax=Daejeonella oryzae TaxID=1122943 RepID=UPI00042322D4|nr:sugar transferase [Daejeonella oryzae]